MYHDDIGDHHTGIPISFVGRPEAVILISSMAQSAAHPHTYSDFGQIQFVVGSTGSTRIQSP